MQAISPTSFGRMFFYVLAVWLAAIAEPAAARDTPTAREEEIFRQLGMGPMRDWSAQGVTYAEWLLNVGLLHRQLELVTSALAYGADANKAKVPYPLSTNGDNGTPLYRAVLSPASKVEIVDALLVNGADVNARYSPSYFNPNKAGLSLYEQVRLRQFQSEEDTGRFVLYDAAAHSNPAVVERLIAAGADVNARTGKFQRTALFATRDVEIGSVLIAHGAGVNVRDANGETPLSLTKRWITDIRRWAASTPANFATDERLEKAQKYQQWLIRQGAQE